LIYHQLTTDLPPVIKIFNGLCNSGEKGNIVFIGI